MYNIEELNYDLENTGAENILKYFIDKYGTKAVLSSSFSIEDQVITHMLSMISKDPEIFTLDTGRLPYETYNLIDKTREHYNIKIDVYFPDYTAVEEMVKEKGVNLFYDSVENRKRCCHIRKVEPLKRALKEKEVWITGLRKEQSVTRENLKIVEYDNGYEIIKVNPLLNWTEKQIWDYIKSNNIPYNQLYKQNYRSIGCAPCTRPVQEGGNIRDGRWWWENPDSKECGLHVK
jgi:phosphoadenosine phosphosulfate reductase